jgi:hypothetical protein
MSGVYFSECDDELPALEPVYKYLDEGNPYLSDTIIGFILEKRDAAAPDMDAWERDARAIRLIFKHQFPNYEHVWSFERHPLGDTEDIAWFIQVAGAAAARSRE